MTRKRGRIASFCAECEIASCCVRLKTGAPCRLHAVRSDDQSASERGARTTRRTPTDRFVIVQISSRLTYHGVVSLRRLHIFLYEPPIFAHRLTQTQAHLGEILVPGHKFDRAAEDDVVEEHRLVGRPARFGNVVVRLGRRGARVYPSAEPAKVRALPRLSEVERRLPVCAGYVSTTAIVGACAGRADARG